MKKVHLYLLALPFILFACNNEEDTSNVQQLQGDWDMTSFTIDGTEILAATPTSELDFGKYDGAEGDFEWVFTDKNGITTRLMGKYELNDAQNEIELNYNNGTKQEYALAIKQNKLVMEGDIVDNIGIRPTNRIYRHIIKADKE